MIADKWALQKDEGGDSGVVFTLYIIGIPPEFSTHTLKNLFATYGKVLSSRILNAKEPGKPRAGFVEFRTRTEADNAIRNLNRVQFGSFQLKVEYAKPRETTSKAVLPQKSIMSLIEKLEIGPLVEQDLKELTQKLEDEHCTRISSPRRNDDGDKKELEAGRSSVCNGNGSNIEEIEPSDIQKMSVERMCHVCKKQSSTFCGECRTVYYCSRGCQNDDWASHKIICKKINMMKVESDVVTQNDDEPLVYVCNTGKHLEKNMIIKQEEEKIMATKLPVHHFEIGDTKDMNVVDLNVTSGVIYCQGLQPQSNITLDDLQEKLKKWFGSTESMQLCDPHVGSIGATIFSEDNQWYRMQVNDIQGGNAVVCFVDYGNSEVKPLQQLKVLPQEFFKYPTFVVGFKLAEVDDRGGWSEEAVRVFTSYLQQNTSITVVVKDVIDGQIFVNVICGEVCFNDEIVKNNWMKAKPKKENVNHNLIEASLGEKVTKIPPQTNSDPTKNLNQCSPKEIQTTNVSAANPKVALTRDELPKDMFSLVITSATDPGNFYFQVVNESLTVLNEYLNDITLICSENENGALCALEPGFICAALYEEDSMWYRGKILEVGADEKVKVLLIDYGNIEHVSPQNIRALPSNFHSLPIQAYNGSLSDCHPVNENWSNKAVEVLKACRDNALSAKLVSHRNDHSALIIYIDSNTTLQDYFISNEMAVKEATKRQERVVVASNRKMDITRAPKKVIQYCDKLRMEQPVKGKTTSINITSCSKSGSFSCQLVSDRLIKLSDLLVKLTACCNDLPKGNFTNLAPRSICAAFFEEDQCWYRACILSRDGDRFVVEYIDYGNTSTVSSDELMGLPMEFGSLPVQGLKCSLSNMEPLGGNWSDDYITVVSSCIGEPLDVKFIGKCRGEYSILAPKLINLLVLYKCGQFCL